MREIAMQKPKTHHRLPMLVSIILSNFIVGCSDPAIHSLDEASLSNHYDKAYWQAQKHKNSKVWKRALAFCHQSMENAIKPNCQRIADLSGDNAWMSQAPAVPTYGSGHGFGAEDFKGMKSVPTQANKS